MRKEPVRHKVTRKTKSGKTVTYWRGKGAEERRNLYQGRSRGKVIPGSYFERKMEEYKRPAKDLLPIDPSIKANVPVRGGNPVYRKGSGFNFSEAEKAKARIEARINDIYHKQGKKAAQAAAKTAGLKSSTVIIEKTPSRYEKRWMGSDKVRSVEFMDLNTSSKKPRTTRKRLKK